MKKSVAKRYIIACLSFALVTFAVCGLCFAVQPRVAHAGGYTDWDETLMPDIYLYRKEEGGAIYAHVPEYTVYFYGGTYDHYGYKYEPQSTSGYSDGAFTSHNYYAAFRLWDGSRQFYSMDRTSYDKRVIWPSSAYYSDGTTPDLWISSSGYRDGADPSASSDTWEMSEPFHDSSWAVQFEVTMTYTDSGCKVFHSQIYRVKDVPVISSGPAEAPHDEFDDFLIQDLSLYKGESRSQHGYHVNATIPGYDVAYNYEQGSDWTADAWHYENKQGQVGDSSPAAYFAFYNFESGIPENIGAEEPAFTLRWDSDKYVTEDGTPPVIWFSYEDYSAFNSPQNAYNDLQRLLDPSKWYVCFYITLFDKVLHGKDFHGPLYRLDNIPVINVGDVVPSDVSDAYDAGYGTGYEAGDADGYNRGVDAGYKSGEKSGFAKGYTNGYNEGVESAGTSFGDLMFSVVDAPVQVFGSIFDVEILGVNLKGFLLSLLSICLVVCVVRLFL